MSTITSPPHKQNPYQQNVEVNFTIHDSINEIREQFNVAAVLFDDLKHSAMFIHEVFLKCGVSSEQIDAIKEKIESLFMDINDSVFQASTRIIEEVTRNTEALTSPRVDPNTNSVFDSSTRETPYEELFIKYNEALNQNVQLEAEKTELAQKFNDLQDHAADLLGQIDALEQQKETLEEQLEEAKQQRAEQTKENVVESVEARKSASFEPSMPAGDTTQTNNLAQKSKTVEDFIETFESVFKDCDEVVQLIKQLGGQVHADVFKIRQPQALEKARMLRQVINSVLQTFRKAKINPTVLSSDLGPKVAEELRKIYNTLVNVKNSTENFKSVRGK